MALSIESLRLVDTLLPRSVYLFPYGFVGVLVKSFQFSSWILWDWSFGNPAFWSSFHFWFAAGSHSTFSENHLSRVTV